MYLIRKNGQNLLKQINRTTICIKMFYSKDTDSSDKDNEIELPPEPTTCCMSGCANCVWIDYVETLSKLFQDSDEKAAKIVLDKMTDPNMKAFLSMELRARQAQKNNDKDK